jgi:predicted NodU family carbamoyl transferase
VNLYGKGILNGINSINKSVWSQQDNAVTLTKTYEAVTNYLGWEGIEGGKTMGLAPYGKQNQIFQNYLKMEEEIKIFLYLTILLGLL